MTYGIHQCSNSNQVTNGFPLWMTMWGQSSPCAVTIKRTFNGIHSACGVQQIRVLFEPFRTFAHLFIKETAFCIQPWAGRTLTAHLNSNWSWHKDIRHGECSWTLTVATAVDVSGSALYLNVFGESGNLHCQEGNRPSHTYADMDTLSQSSECQPCWTAVRLTPWNPLHS